jgi:putative Ca2+/H+ antiporter (TMEM165/GDT1 family)
VASKAVAQKQGKFCRHSDDEGGAPVARKGVFVATLIAFFVAEIGYKTQVATVALAAAYSNLAVVVIGTTLGMLTANLPWLQAA